MGEEPLGRAERLCKVPGPVGLRSPMGSAVTLESRKGAARQEESQLG